LDEQLTMWISYLMKRHLEKATESKPYDKGRQNKDPWSEKFENEDLENKLAISFLNPGSYLQLLYYLNTTRSSMFVCLYRVHYKNLNLLLHWIVPAMFSLIQYKDVFLFFVHFGRIRGKQHQILKIRKHTPKSTKKGGIFQRENFTKRDTPYLTS
jgi:hypothetical protein